MNSRKRVLHAHIEAVSGTAETLVAADAIVTKGLEIMPLEGGTISRDLDRSSFGADQQLHIGTHVKIKFMCELVGSGTLGTAPAFGPLLKACGMAEIIVAVTSVRYKPDTSSTVSLTMQFNLDGSRHRMVGAKGTCKFKLTSQQIPYIEFEFTGLYVAPVAEVPLALDGYSAFQVPLPVNFANTPTIHFAGITSGIVLNEIELDLGNKVEHFDNPGEEKVEITDREGKGSAKLLSLALGTLNVFTLAKANTLNALKVVHGTVNATKAILECPAGTAQILQPKYGDDRGRATIECGLSLVPTSANDDEIELRFAAA